MHAGIVVVNQFSGAEMLRFSPHLFPEYTATLDPSDKSDQCSQGGKHAALEGDY